MMFMTVHMNLIIILFHFSIQGFFKPKSGLTFKDEITLTLTKLLLELLNRDLTHKFNISESEISKLFTTWIKLLTNWVSSDRLATLLIHL
jgi:hypothetical protein